LSPLSTSVMVKQVKQLRPVRSDTSTVTACFPQCVMEENSVLHHNDIILT